MPGFSLRSACTELRRRAGLDQVETLRREGAPIPLEPLKNWDNGRDILLWDRATYDAEMSAEMGPDDVKDFFA